MITHTMRIAPEQMAQAFLVFLREKPFLKITRKILIIGFTAVLSMLLMKFFVAQWTWGDAFIFILAFSWLLFGTKITLWRIRRQLTNHMARQEMRTTLSPQGIVWEGGNMQNGSVKWQNIAKVMQTATGFIVMFKGRKFLWLPFSGFELSAKKVNEFFVARGLKVTTRPKIVI